MEVIYPRCAGLDVHKETVVACVRIVEEGEVTRSVVTVLEFARIEMPGLGLQDMLGELGPTPPSR